MTAYSDFLKYFQNTSPGTTQDWASGTLSMGDNGLATYIDPIGNTIDFTKETSLSDLYGKNPYIARQWETQYPGVFGTQANDQLFNLFQPDLIPTTRSGSTSSSSSLSGINWENPLLQQLSSQLGESIGGLPTLTQNYSKTLQDQYENLMNNALGPQAFQGTLNNLVANNILNSSVASNALGNTASNIATDIGQQAYQSQLAGLEAQMNLPSLLSGLASTLGQQTKSSTDSSQSSSTTNPLAPYELLSNFLLNY